MSLYRFQNNQDFENLMFPFCFGGGGGEKLKRLLIDQELLGYSSFLLFVYSIK